MPKKIKKEVIAAKISFNLPDNLVRRYATNMTVQKGESEFLLSFYEAYPPMFIGSKEEISKQIENMDEVQANCVASVIIPENKMPEFIKTLQRFYNAQLGPLEKEDSSK